MVLNTHLLPKLFFLEGVVEGKEEDEGQNGKGGGRRSLEIEVTYPFV